MKQWAVWLAAFCLASWVASVSAHEAQLVESSPGNGDILEAAPQQISARFSEEIVYEESWLKVLNSAGEQVDNGDGGVDLNNPERDSLLATMPASLPDDVYTVEWQVMLLDGDVTEGAFTFTLGNPTAVELSEEYGQSDSAKIIVWLATVAGLVLVLVLITILWRKKVY